MDKKMSNRFKQLIGESIAEDKTPLLSSGNVTDSKIADQLSEMEAEKLEAFNLDETEENELSEGWDESEEEISEDGVKETSYEKEECEDKDYPLNESEEVVYSLTFLNEKKEK